MKNLSKMMCSNKSKEVDLSTETKIKDAARKVFTQKGYFATRTRDIAEEADINLALLNYYFRSKEKLFQIVMGERVEEMFGILEPIINDQESDLEHKLYLFIDVYMDMLAKNPDLPLFVLSEVKNNPQHFEGEGSFREIFECSILIKQLKETKPNLNPYHFLINIMAICIFPFIIQPIFNSTSFSNEVEYQLLLDERKKLIPIWTKALLNSHDYG